jgi:hypothetical protein
VDPASPEAGRPRRCSRRYKVTSVARRRPLRYTLILASAAMSAVLAAAGGWR